MKILRTFLVLAILSAVYFLTFKLFNIHLPWNEALACSIAFSPALVIIPISLLDFIDKKILCNKVEESAEEELALKRLIKIHNIDQNIMPESNLTMQSPIIHLIARASEFGIEITPAGAEEILKNNNITKDPFFLSRKEIENLCNQLLN